MTRTVTDDPSTPGRQDVSAITFHDANNPVKLGEAAGTCVQTDANTVTCSVGDYTFNLGPNDDTATITGAPTALPSPTGQPESCPGFPSIFDATGGAGNDTINGSEGSDSFRGGPGNDTLNGNGGADSIDADSGDDTVHGNDGSDCLDGGDGNDNINGDAGDDSLDGGGDSRGDDALNGGDGNDYLFPGFGPFDAGGIQTDNDTLSGGNGVDTTDYTSRTNRTVALTETEDGVANDGTAAHKNGAGTDIPAEADNIGGDIENIFGGAGPNTMTGNDQDNRLYGGVSNDNIQGAGGDDSIGGNAGQDTLGGGDGRDNISGDNGNDALDGGAGDDVLYGGAQNDTVGGGPGDDVINNGFDGPSRPDATVPDTDSDVFNGGDGVDLVTYAGRGPSDPVTVKIDGQANDGEIGVPNRLTENDNVGTDVEDVTGTDGADSLTGSPADNDLTGGDGNDTLVGNGGNDGLFGLRGADVLNAAGAGSTHLDGGDGNDTLVSQDATRDEDQCGGGTDSVQADGRDEVHGDCENVKVAPPGKVVIGKVSVTKTGYVLVRITCPATEPSCAGILTIKTKKKFGKIKLKLGNPSYRANGGKVAVVKALIPPKFRATLGKAKKVALTVTVTNVNAVTGLSSSKSATKTVKTTVLKKKK